MCVKTDENQRFSYFAGFAARRPATAGQFRPVARGGTSYFLQGKIRKNSKKWLYPFLRKSARLTVGKTFAIIIKLEYGEMSEWFMELVLKTSDAARHRGFESLSLRQKIQHSANNTPVEKYPSGCKGLPC